MPLLTPTVWVILVAAFLQVITGLGWFISGVKLDKATANLAKCETQHKSFVEDTKRVAALQAEKARVREAEDRRIADETAKSWAANLDYVRADAARRLRVEAARNTRGSGVSAATQTGLSAPTASADPVPAPDRVAADCAEATLTANFLQAYLERLQR